MDSEYHTLRHHVCGFYVAFEHDYPAKAVEFIKGSAWFRSISEDMEPDDLSAPQKYIDTVLPIYTRIYRIETTNSRYEALSADLKAEWEELYSKLSTYVGKSMQADIAEGFFKSFPWDVITAEGLQAGFDKFEERQVKPTKH